MGTIKHGHARTTRRIEIDGEVVCLTEAAARQGLQRAAVSMRLRRGWSIDRALGLAA